MDVLPLDGWLDAACDLFNESVARLPHCFPVEPEELRSFFRCWTPRARQPLQLAAVEENRLLGFAFGEVNTEVSARLASPDDGLLTGLFCRSMEAGAALLSRVEQYFTLLRCRQIVAFDAGERHNQLPFFNGGFGACPEALPFTPRVLCQSGFTFAARELNMTVRIGGDGCARRVPLLSAPPGIQVEWRVESLESLEVRAVDGRRVAGTCTSHVLGSRQKNLSASQTGYISWLGVDQEYQRQGIGRFLLSLMLDRMASLGLNRVFLTTGSQNWRAQPLYCSLGFVVTGTSATLIRTLTGGWDAIL